MFLYCFWCLKSKAETSIKTDMQKHSICINKCLQLILLDYQSNHYYKWRLKHSENHSPCRQYSKKNFKFCALQSQKCFTVRFENAFKKQYKILLLLVGTLLQRPPLLYYNCKYTTSYNKSITCLTSLSSHAWRYIIANVICALCVHIRWIQLCNGYPWKNNYFWSVSRSFGTLNYIATL